MEPLANQPADLGIPDRNVGLYLRHSATAKNLNSPYFNVLLKGVSIEKDVNATQHCLQH